MARSISIDPLTGSIGLGDGVRLNSNDDKAGIESQIADWLHGWRNLDNGYERLDLHEVRFGGLPASLSLCFNDSRLMQAAWNVQLPNAPIEGGWPTRHAIEDELKFVRATLTNEMGFDIAVRLSKQKDESGGRVAATPQIDPRAPSPLRSSSPTTRPTARPCSS